MPLPPNPAGFAALVFCLHVLPIAALEFWVRRRHQAAYMRHRELLVCLGVSSVLYWAPVMGEWLCVFCFVDWRCMGLVLTREEQCGGCCLHGHAAQAGPRSR